MGRPVAVIRIEVEGEYLVARYGVTDHPDDSVVLGTLHAGALARHQHRRTDWIDLLKHLGTELARDAIGDHVRRCDVTIEDPSGYG